MSDHSVDEREDMDAEIECHADEESEQKNDIHHPSRIEPVISTLKLSGWPINLVFNQLKEYSISLNCYKDIYP